MTPWADCMDLGIVHALAFPEAKEGSDRLLETIRAVAEDSDFGAIELAPIPDPGVRRTVREWVAFSQLQVVYLPILNILFEPIPLADADPDRRSWARRRVEALLDEALELDAVLAMIASPPDPGPSFRAAAVERLAEDIRALCRYADARASRRRLTLTLENFDRDVEKKRLIGPTSEAAALAERVDCDNFGLTVDLSHLPLLREQPHAALTAAAPYLVHAHVGNCVADNPEDPVYGDFHPPFGYPGSANGVGEVAQYFAALDDIGYWQRAQSRLQSRAIVSFEIKPARGEPSWMIVANGKRTVFRAWSAFRRGRKRGAPA